MAPSRWEEDMTREEWNKMSESQRRKVLNDYAHGVLNKDLLDRITSKDFDSLTSIQRDLVEEIPS